MKKQNQFEPIAIMGFGLFCAVRNVPMQNLSRIQGGNERGDEHE